ncbi:MAG: hypothetical protein M0D55_14670 [Elusimicrobiota bacterium]|nr:MAG: hypothetical protein M0D55_14670 [Elusimicrobiota bacterium]
MSSEEFDSVTRQALRAVSYFVILISVLMLIPFPFWLILRANMKSLNRDAFVSSAMFLFSISMTGQLLIWLGMIVVGVAALWTYRKTQNHGAQITVLRRGSLRLLPVLVWTVLIFINPIIYPDANFFGIPALGGLILFGYGYYLLTLDRTPMAAE